MCRAPKRPPTAKPAPAPHRTRTLAKTPAQHARKTPPTRRRQNKQRKADPGSSWWNSSRNKVSRRKSAGERPVRPHCCRRAARSRRELEGKERNALWEIRPANKVGEENSKILVNVPVHLTRFHEGVRGERPFRPHCCRRAACSRRELGRARSEDLGTNRT